MSKAEEDFRGSGVAVLARRPLGTLAELSLASSGAAHARHRPACLGVPRRTGTELQNVSAWWSS